jgi:hypothetical protein
MLNPSVMKLMKPGLGAVTTMEAAIWQIVNPSVLVFA